VPVRTPTHGWDSHDWLDSPFCWHLAGQMQRVPWRCSLGVMVSVIGVAARGQVPAPLTTLTALSRLQLLDMRGIHEEAHNYWTDAKCTTMNHVSGLMKLMRRRGTSSRVLMDVR
jgi:hypothetical protein